MKSPDVVVLRLEVGVGAGLDRRDLRAGHDRPARVLHRAGDDAAIGLRHKAGRSADTYQYMESDVSH